MCLALALLFAAPTACAAPSAERLFQSGLYQEEVKGDLEAAIKIYERIVAGVTMWRQLFSWFSDTLPALNNP